jgi:hypothetical protein
MKGNRIRPICASASGLVQGTVCKLRHDELRMQVPILPPRHFDGRLTVRSTRRRVHCRPAGSDGTECDAVRNRLEADRAEFQTALQRYKDTTG